MRKNKRQIEFEERISLGIKLYLEGNSGIKSASMAKVSHARLCNRLKTLGLSRSNKINSRKYYVDHNYFSSIIDESRAYWLGFIYADGYVTTSANKVGIALGIKDKDHLNLYLNAISSNYPIKTYWGESFGGWRQYARVIVSSDQMRNDLINLGVVPKKTPKVTFPSNGIVPEKFMNHFIRGYFDGDGSFAKNGHGGFSVKVLGTENLLNGFANKIGFPEKNLYDTISEKAKALEIGGRQQVLKIGRYMYENATIFMKRKKDRYDLINY